MSIRLSPKHGVNPSVSVCFFCQQDKNEVVLPGMLKGDAEAPHRGVWNREPCDQCKGYMEKGIILISMDENLTEDFLNPYRSGGWCVIKEEAIKRMIVGDSANQVLKERFAFVPDDVWDQFGLPKA